MHLCRIHCQAFGKLKQTIGKADVTCNFWFYTQRYCTKHTMALATQKYACRTCMSSDRPTYSLGFCLPLHWGDSPHPRVWFESRTSITTQWIQRVSRAYTLRGQEEKKNVYLPVSAQVLERASRSNISPAT